jgi:hypothetical protein
VVRKHDTRFPHPKTANGTLQVLDEGGHETVHIDGTVGRGARHSYRTMMVLHGLPQFLK